MGKIIISCDTTIACSSKEIKDNDLYVIPLNVIVDGVEYHDTVDIDNNKLAAMMRNGAKITTSTPTIYEITSYFDNIIAKENPDKIIHFTISSHLSSMFNLFTNVCKENYGDKIIVVDSLSICCWIRQQVYYAKYLVTKGYGANEIIAKVKEDLLETEDCAFVPESIEYLRRGGRINGATAAMANLIGVVPVLTFNHGVVGKKGVTRTYLKAIKNAVDEWNINKNVNDEFIILYSDDSCLERVNRLKELFKEDMNLDVKSGMLSINVMAHTGPGTSGLGLIRKVEM